MGFGQVKFRESWFGNERTADPSLSLICVEVMAFWIGIFGVSMTHSVGNCRSSHQIVLCSTF